MLKQHHVTSLLLSIACGMPLLKTKDAENSVNNTRNDECPPIKKKKQGASPLTRSYEVVSYDDEHRNASSRAKTNH